MLTSTGDIRVLSDTIAISSLHPRRNGHVPRSRKIAAVRSAETRVHPIIEDAPTDATFSQAPPKRRALQGPIAAVAFSAEPSEPRGQTVDSLPIADGDRATREDEFAAGVFTGWNGPGEEQLRPRSREWRPRCGQGGEPLWGPYLCDACETVPELAGRAGQRDHGGAFAGERRVRPTYEGSRQLQERGECEAVLAF